MSIFLKERLPRTLKHRIRQYEQEIHSEMVAEVEKLLSKFFHNHRYFVEKIIDIKPALPYIPSARELRLIKRFATHQYGIVYDIA